MERAKTSDEARVLRDKVERDLEAAGRAAVRVGKLAVRLSMTSKIELAKKFIRAVFDDSEG